MALLSLGNDKAQRESVCSNEPLHGYWSRGDFLLVTILTAFNALHPYYQVHHLNYVLAKSYDISYA